MDIETRRRFRAINRLARAAPVATAHERLAQISALATGDLQPSDVFKSRQPRPKPAATPEAETDEETEDTPKRKTRKRKDDDHDRKR